LGNPGGEFAHTRHNVGADAVALVAQRHGVVLRSERGTASRAVTVVAEGRRLALAIPVTFMNESGIALAGLVRRFSIDNSSSLVVVHDELDLPVGVVRIKFDGGTAGHNGLKSTEQHLGTLEFVRVRIGIGKPTGRMPGADYVLHRPSAVESELIAAAVERAADAVELIFGSGLDAAMGTVNAAG